MSNMIWNTDFSMCLLLVSPNCDRDESRRFEAYQTNANSFMEAHQRRQSYHGRIWPGQLQELSSSYQLIGSLFGQLQELPSSYWVYSSLS